MLLRRLFHSPSPISRVCVGLSVVCDNVHPTQMVEIFRNILAPSNSLGTWAVCIKILEKNSKGF